MTENYLTVNELAEELEVSRATAWKWLKRGDVQTYRFVGDRKTYVKREAVQILRGPIPVDFQKKQAA